MGQAHNQDQRTCILKMRCIQGWDKGALDVQPSLLLWQPGWFSHAQVPEELPVSWIGWSGLWYLGSLEFHSVFTAWEPEELG